MVLQKGQAVPMVCAPVATSSLARAWLTRSPVSSPRNARPRGAAAEAAFLVAWRFDECAGDLNKLARLLVDVA